MKLPELAHVVLDAIEEVGLNFMMVGAIAAGAYGVPRATRDLDLVVEFDQADCLSEFLAKLNPILEFDQQAVFDTMTWGTRHVGRTRSSPPLGVELFELYDDPFVQSEFQRRQQLHLPHLNRATWIPTAEDVVIQKLRWGRTKDRDDVRDILGVQGLAALDMSYVMKWCEEHATTDRLNEVLKALPSD